jgi:uncharacterized membrane protein YjgN (DUF898 family)
MSETGSGTATPTGTRPVLDYDGDVGDLFGVFLMNLILTIITFGIFRFWAITRIRRYLWSHMRFEDTRFIYTGKGRELFFGFIVAMLILILLFAGVAWLSVTLATSHPALSPIPIVIAAIGVMILFGAAHFWAQRYRLSRTEWRGIRGGMTGSALYYGVNWLLYTVLVVVTLYQAVPWMQVGLARRRINASRFGSAIFRCEGRGRHLYLTWLATIAGTVALIGVVAGIVLALGWSSLGQVIEGTLKGAAAEIAIKRSIPIIIVSFIGVLIASGLLATWYYTRLLRILVGNTTAIVPGSTGHDTLRFSTSVTAGNLLWLVVSNLLIAVVTFGFGLPFVLHRTAKYIARTTLVTGTFDAAALVQSTLSRPSLGEGFLQALDPGIV